MNKVLAIYGASGLGREVLELACIINKEKRRWDSLVFVDDGDVPSVVSGHKVYKYDVAKEMYGDSLEFVIGIGEPLTRKTLFAKIDRDAFSTPTLIHPDVYIPDSTKIGNGVVIQYGNFISCDVSIEDYVFIQPQCNIGHDDILEEGCMIAGFGNIAGGVKIGRYSYIGMSSAVKELVRIGDFSVVGMGSVVHKDIPDEMIAMGNPARPIARNEEKKVFKH